MPITNAERAIMKVFFANFLLLDDFTMQIIPKIIPKRTRKTNADYTFN